MESLNVKNINDEKIFNVIDPNGQGEVVNRIRPISISINQKAETINDQTDSTINLAVYWNDTWKSILDLTFDESLRQEYGKLTQDLTNIQKDIDMKQYKDAETKTADFLKYVANLSSKYTAIPEKAVVSKIKNDFVKIKADKNSVKVAISDKLLNFMLKKYAKVDNLDYTKSNECFSTSKFNCLANNYDIYYHSPEIFQKQAYMTVVKDNKVVGSYKVNYDQFSKFASKFMLTPQKLGYSKDRLAGYMKTAEVVMQNIFFDSVDEAKEWQEMVDEKEKEQATTSEGEEETTETTTTETKTEMGEGKSESPIKEDGGLARPSEDFASDEIPESEPRQQEQQGGGQNLGASRRVKNVKKTAKVGYNAEPENMEEEVAIELADELMSAANVALEKAGLLWGGYSGEEQRRQRVDVQKNAIEPLLKGRLKESIQGKVIDLIKEHLTDLNYHTLVSAIEEIMDGKQASKKVKLNKKAGIDMNLSYGHFLKEEDENKLPKFNTLEDIKTYIKTNNKFPGNFFYKGGLFTEDEYDMDGMVVTYGSPEIDKSIIINTPDNRYNYKGNYKNLDMDIVEEDAPYFRTDVNYTLPKKVYEELFPKKSSNKKLNLNKKAEDITEIEENYKESGFNIKYKKLVIKDNAFVQEELKPTLPRIRVDFVIYSNTIPNGMAEVEFHCVVKPSKANATIPHIERYTINYDVALDNEIKKQLDSILYNLSNKKIQDFCKYNDKGFLVYKYQVAANKKIELNKQARTVNSKQDIKQILKDKNAVETRNYGDFVSAIRENKTPVETIKAYGKKKTAGGYDEYVLVVYESGAYFYTELSNGKRVDEKYYKFENVEKKAKEYKRYNVIVKFNDKQEEYEFENDNEFLALDEALGYFGEKWHELPLANEIEKLEEIKVQELDVDDTVLNEYTKEYFVKNKDKFPKYSCNKKALYGDVQEQDIVPAKTETKVYLQSEKVEDFVWLINGSGRIEILAPKALVMGATGSGDNSEGVNKLRDYIKKDLEKISVEEMQKTVSEYGIDNVKEMDKDELERYLVWLLAGDTADNLENRLADEEDLENIKAKNNPNVQKQAEDKGNKKQLPNFSVTVRRNSDDEVVDIIECNNQKEAEETYKYMLSDLDKDCYVSINKLVGKEEYTEIKNSSLNKEESCKKANKNKLVNKKAEEQTVEEKIEQQVGEDGDIKATIGVGDVVTVNFDLIDNSTSEFEKYEEFIGKPMLLMETDKEDINKVIIEETEYPFQRLTIDTDKVELFDDMKGTEIVVEDTDGDEMITTFEELPVVAKQCKVKSIHKAANITKKKANLKAINSLEDVAGLIDDILSDYDWYDYADALEVGEKSHYENILAAVQKDEKGEIEGVLKYIAEDDNGYTAPEVEQLKEYYNAKFGGK